MRKTYSLLVAGLALLAGAGIAAAEPVTVFGAASVTDALEEIGDIYAERGGEVQFSFASSSTLARQIEAGAPAAVFISASESWMDYLAERDLINAASRTSPIGNRLVLIAPSDSALTSVEIGEDTDIAALLGADQRLAVGDPEHVPAGIYARQALETLGQWDATEARLARADNVRAALALVETGEAPLGIVYATDAAATDKVKVVGTFPRTSHEPITYAFALIKGAESPEVQALYAFLTGPQAIAVFARYGFAAD
ncbi:molybdate ABC transporter substrate-binding protein [Microbaculum marinum]|uniref:Molybdate ABC transporter substrate-binding protein n=1 Tax=Microbaculum marinum TaxID=1764581 RepID=A0AAW9S076_9HYPH